MRGDRGVAEFVALYGIWLVATFIALESVGFPLPAEAALITAGVFAGSTNGIDIWLLISIGTLAAICGEIVGFWVGRTYGCKLLSRYGVHLGLTEDRAKIGRWLFQRYGTRFVFTARFLPFLRNIAAVLAGTHDMPQRAFYLSSWSAAAIWIMGYGLGAYWFGAIVIKLASPAAIATSVAAAVIVLSIPAIILRYEKRLLAMAELGLAAPPHQPQARTSQPAEAGITALVPTKL
jgi:membrane protein DedA with SNARE-associated domain